jgi:hypothetical protein
MKLASIALSVLAVCASSALSGACTDGQPPAASDTTAPPLRGAASGNRSLDPLLARPARMIVDMAADAGVGDAASNVPLPPP